MSSSSASGRSSGAPGRSRRMASRQTAKKTAKALALSDARPTRVGPASKKPASKKPASKKPAPKKPVRAPRPVRQFVRWLVRGPKKTPRKVLMAGGSVATLAVLVIVPTRVGSQQVDLSSCQEVVQSGAEISRAQVDSLLAVPEGSRREAVRQVIDVPYCLLPSQKENSGAREESREQTNEKAREEVSEKASEKESETVTEVATTVIEREAYPLAFDPEAWVVVRYTEGEYAGYDFVFKP